MNSKVADRLNDLRLAARPLTLALDRGWVYSDGTRPLAGDATAKELHETLLKCVAGYAARAQSDEIREAALGERSAETVAPDWSYYWARQEGISWPLTRRAWVLAWPVVQAIVQNDNVRRRAEYEDYRQVCAQGVARALDE